VLEQARTLGGVKSAALAHAVPMVPFGSDPHRIVPEGVQLPPGTEAISAPVTTVSDGYFGTLDVPILEGREFQSTDGAESQRVAIVNEVFAKKYYPNRSAIGKRFRLDGPSGPLVEIVGVARQSKYVFAVEPPLDYVYLPLAQNPQPSGMSIMLETTGPSGSVAGSLRDLVRSLDAGQPLFGVRTMEEVFDVRDHEDPSHTDRNRSRDGAARAGPGDGRTLRCDVLLGQSAGARDRHPHGDRS